MTSKYITLALLTATLITGSAAVARADSNISGENGGSNTEASMEGDWQRHHPGGIYGYASAPYVVSPVRRATRTVNKPRTAQHNESKTKKMI